MGKMVRAEQKELLFLSSVFPWRICSLEGKGRKREKCKHRGKVKEKENWRERDEKNKNKEGLRECKNMNVLRH